MAKHFAGFGLRSVEFMVSTRSIALKGLMMIYADKEKMRETRKRWRQTNPEKYREYRLRFRFGVTIEQYEAMSLEQDGKCAICKTIPLQKLEVDHDHVTGKVRGL